MLTGWRKLVSKLFLIPQRYVVGIFGLLAVMNAYTMRQTLSIAITEMVISTSSNSTNPDSCPVDSDSGSSNSTSSSNNDNLYDWDETTQGLILSSFYWGYVLTHIPGGILAERYGGKYSLSLGLLSTAIFTLLTPVFVGFGDYKWLIFLRVLIGLGEGTTMPALNALLSKWVPKHERGRIGSMAFAGSQIGTIVGNSLSGIIIDAAGTWEPVFYVFGSVGIAWFCLFTLLCYSDPEVHPFISDEEKSYLRKELQNVKTEVKVIPWRQILTSAPLLALIVAQIGHDWGFFVMVTDLPKYMSDVLKFKVKENGLWSSLPYVIMWFVSISSGYFCDWLIKNEYMSITMSRRVFTSIASIGPGVFMIGASYAGCDRAVVVALFTIAMGFMGTFYCGMKVNALDLSPNYSGTLMALVNGVGAVSGIITPYLIGALTEDHTVLQWRVVFWITLGVLTATNIVYAIWCSGETQWWNDPDHPNFKRPIENGALDSNKFRKEKELNSTDAKR